MGGKGWPLSVVGIGALALLAASAARAQTTNYGNWSPYQYNDNIWQPMDACRAQAQQQYPNWTGMDAEGRARATALCLRSGILPPMTPLGPSTWPPEIDGGSLNTGGGSSSR
ncbi:MAG TPA: hypothetical protein VMA53_01130 [Stellaceae bacterium]|nr:hypothetical protein [Stellaceae bacterium]